VKRLFLVGCGTLVLAAAVIVVQVFTSVESSVEAAIERIGSDVTGTRVRIDDVDISMSSGSGELRGLRVASPEGFREDDVFRFDEVRIAIDLRTISRDPVVIREIVFREPRVRYDGGAGGTNVGRILKHVEEYEGGDEGPGLILERVYFRDGEIRVSASDATTPLPDLYLQDVGKAEGGATPVQVAQKLMAGLARKIGSAVSRLDRAGAEPPEQAD
jgi:hypothetical protein